MVKTRSNRGDRTAPADLIALDIEAKRIGKKYATKVQKSSTKLRPDPATPGEGSTSSALTGTVPAIPKHAKPIRRASTPTISARTRPPTNRRYSAENLTEKKAKDAPKVALEAPVIKILSAEHDPEVSEVSPSQDPSEGTPLAEMKMPDRPNQRYVGPPIANTPDLARSPIMTGSFARDN